jgi:hypothetical protein
MSRGYIRVQRRRWQIRGRRLLCCYGPCPRYARSAHTVWRDGVVWAYCSEAHLRAGPGE